MSALKVSETPTLNGLHILVAAILARKQIIINIYDNEHVEINLLDLVSYIVCFFFFFTMFES